MRWLEMVVIKATLTCSAAGTPLQRDGRRTGDCEGKSKKGIRRRRPRHVMLFDFNVGGPAKKSKA